MQNVVCVLKRASAAMQLLLPSLIQMKLEICRACVIDSQGIKADHENALLRYLCHKINATGPITVAEYMKEVLINPHSGYYMNKDVFGSTGDFITSPEISQMFGELIGVWFYNEWSKIGRPKPFQLVEFGPGRGTLAEDILRVFRKLNVTEKSFSLHLVEVSPFMQKLQAAKLCDAKVESEKPDAGNQDTISDPSLEFSVTKFGYPVTWHHSLHSVPEGFSLFLAHEFFDALPIHKLKKTAEGWKEILIDCKDGKLQFVLSRNPTPASKMLVNPNEKRNEVELCSEGGVLMSQIATRIEEDGGISLIVDYGYSSGEKSDTFRGFREHALHNPLIDPGKADLTADVDFDFLKQHASGKAVSIGPITQASFLQNMGIEIRLERLLQSCSTEEQKLLRNGYHMLVDKNQMGERYKFLALFPQVLKDFLLKCPPCGFT